MTPMKTNKVPATVAKMTRANELHSECSRQRSIRRPPAWNSTAVSNCNRAQRDP